MTTTQNPTAAKLTATDVSFDIRLAFPTAEEAEAFAALLPKSVKAQAVTSTGPLDDSYLNGTVESGAVNVYGVLAANGINGGRNEAGIKRYRAAVKALTALGVELEYSAPYTNSYPTREAFEAATA